MVTKASNDNGKTILTVEDLMERWGVGKDTVLAHVKAGTLAYLNVGVGTSRSTYRFRLAAVEAWEAARERVREVEAAPTSAVPALSGLPPTGWDGKNRLKRRG